MYHGGVTMLLKIILVFSNMILYNYDRKKHIIVEHQNSFYVMIV